MSPRKANKTMVRRVSSSQLIASSPQKTMSSSFPKLSEILVNLSVKDSPKVVKRLKLVGDPYEFTEYIDKKYVPNPGNDPALKGKTQRVPFPDADLNKSFNRIGHEDPDQCPWKKLGYIATTQYAQNCFERQEDGSWEVKILKKGKSIFKAIAMEQLDRLNNEDLDEDDPKHFGTRVSPCVRITATATGLEGPKSVEYSISYDPKSTSITDEMIEMLRKCGEPSAEDLEEERVEYNKAAKRDNTLPMWEDFFAYGYPLHKIFKHTPMKSNNIETVDAPKKNVVVEEEEMEADLPPVSKASNDDDDDDFAIVQPKSVRKAAPKPVVVENDDDDDEEQSLGWMQ
jgi:hypothetical protein